MTRFAPTSTSIQPVTPTRYRTLIVDGSYLVRRPWEAGGRSACIGASVGVLLDLIERHTPEVAYVCWEGPPGAGHRGRSNRRALDVGYKAKRCEWPAELLELVADLRRVYSQLGIVQAWCEDEADDAAAALVAHEPGPHLLWSADKDWLQLVRCAPRSIASEGSAVVHLLRDYRGSDHEPITPETIVERTGLTAAGWTAYLSLAGDTSDGIAGVPKIGDQRARALLAAVPLIVDLALDPLQPDAEGRARAMEQAMRSDASICRWVGWVFDHLAHLRLASQLVALRPDSPLTVTPAAPAQELAEWLVAEGLPHIARQLSSAVRVDPWEDLPF